MTPEVWHLLGWGSAWAGAVGAVWLVGWLLGYLKNR